MYTPSKQPSMLTARHGDKTGQEARSKQKMKSRGCSNMVLEKAAAQPLGFPSMPLPSLSSVPQALKISALQRADLLVFAGPQPHPHHVNSGASFEEPPASPSNMLGKSQGTGVNSSPCPSTDLGQNPCLPPSWLFVPLPQAWLHSPSPQAIPGSSSEGVMTSLSIFTQPTAK